MLAKYYTFAGVLRMLAILRMLALQGGGSLPLETVPDARESPSE